MYDINGEAYFLNTKTTEEYKFDEIMNDARMMEMNNHHFYMGQNQCLLCPTLDNTVYILENGQCNPYVTFNYNGKNPMITEEDIQQAIANSEWIAGKEKTFYGGMVVESPNLIIRRMGDENAKDVILNKKMVKSSRQLLILLYL